MRFVILGIHEPGFVPGVTVLTARVRIFKDDGTTDDADFPLPDIPGIQFTMDHPVTQHMLTPMVNQYLGQ